ncbi:MAG: shikimate dehydrogenase [Bacteroidota bacterium]
MMQFGLIGKKLSHSFSPIIFEEKFLKSNIEASYHLFEIEKIDDFGAILSNNPNLRGLNITIPYKQEIIPFLTSVSSEVKSIQAVNTVVINRNNNEIETIGYNTDVYGFEHSIKPFLEMHHHRALIIGTGGASKAVYYVLKNIGIDCLFVSRNPKKNNEVSYQQLNKFIFDNHYLIVNTSPVGMFPNSDEFPDIPYQYITDKHLCYDLIYNPADTQFLIKSKQVGATIMNGWQMLNFQAEKAWQIWND